MRILGIDPGTLKMGYGLIEEHEEELITLDYGVLVASRRRPLAERLHCLYLELTQVVALYHPDEMAVEEPFVAQNARSALAIGRAQAVAMLVAAANNIPVYGYLPARVKQTVADYGGSDKEQIQQMVGIHLKLAETPQPSDAADALAVALCHLQEKRLARLLATSGR
jgi:crossover junction endodeoxyribonuclease RuvC